MLGIYNWSLSLGPVRFHAIHSTQQIVAALALLIVVIARPSR